MTSFSNARALLGACFLSVLALVAAPAMAAPAPATAAPARAGGPKRLAVLTLSAPWNGECLGTAWHKDKFVAERCSVLETLADEARSGAVAALRGQPWLVMTRENTAFLLKENGTGVCAEGECEVETAKLIGADLVVSGNVSLVEGTWFVTLKLHEVRTANLLETAKVVARSQVDLILGVQGAAEDLVQRGLGIAGAAPRVEAKAAAASRTPAKAERSAPQAAGGTCPQGQEDVAGHCCWPGQDWATRAGRCIGTPTCPDGYIADGETCRPGCPEPKSLIGGHCCWPGQDWAARAGRCVGTASCPAETAWVRDGCVPIPQGMAFIEGGGAKTADDAAAVATFFLDVTEVPVSAYARCVAAGKCETPLEPMVAASDGSVQQQSCNWAVADRPDHPVNCVTWDGAAAYCAWVGKRLPTENEWEWAARGAGRGTTYPWGNEQPAGQLCWSGPGSRPGSRTRNGTCAIGAHPRGDSAQGIKDLAGNVVEWTSTWRLFGRVYRGGGWRSADAGSVAASFRESAAAATSRDDLGFRCARSL